MRIARSMVDQIVAQARAEAPNECCGIVGTRDGDAVRVVPLRNAAASPLRYEMDDLQLLGALESLEDEGLDVGAIYHSHTRSAPEPSQTDINLANPLFGDPVYLIVGVKDAAVDDVRGWHIADGRIAPATLEVVEG